MTHRLLAFFAHPDDESFGLAGSIAKLAAQRIPTTLVCATRGEVGQISHPALATAENIGAVRERELRAAAQAMKLDRLLFLDYRDSGMEGTDENHDPRAFVNQPAQEVVPRLAQIIRQVRPSVVVTFDPQGGYGHPDHIAIHQHAVAAFHAAAAPSYMPALGEPWQASRLFYNVIPRSRIALMRDQMAGLGEDPSRFDRFAERAWPDEKVHLTVDVTGQFAAKWQALMCHRTQLGDEHLFRRIDLDTVQQIMGREHFALAWPDPTPDMRLETLFDGLARGSK